MLHNSSDQYPHNAGSAVDNIGPPTLGIVIVNWNAGDQLLSCLKSISSCDSEFLLTGVIVVDNASSDLSLQGLDKIDLPLCVIRNTANRGFAAACNQGARASTANYLLFLNPDTVLKDASISKPICFLEDPSNRSIGIVGVRLLGDADEVARKCCRFPTPQLIFNEITGLTRISSRFFPGPVMVEWTHDVNCRVDHVMGAYYMVRRRLFEELGGFDERFFVYREDLDFSLRASQSGSACYYLADVEVFHKGGGTSSQVKSSRLFYAMRSRTQYAYKHFNLMSATGLLAATFLLEPMARLVWALKRGTVREVLDTLVATIRLFAWAALYPINRAGR